MRREQDWIRRAHRFPLEVDGIAHRSDGSAVPVTVRNFSDQGCRVEAGRDFHLGERLRIAVPRMGAIKAQVRWALPGAAGTRFLTESDF